mgnify:CR=1 FL=1
MPTKRKLDELYEIYTDKSDIEIIVVNIPDVKETCDKGDIEIISNKLIRIFK